MFSTKPRIVQSLLKHQNKRIRQKKQTGLAIALSALTCLQLGWAFSSERLPAAYAQAVTDEDIESYARAVFDIEAKRLAAYEAASDILATADSELSILETPLSCTRNRMSDMPDISRTERLELRTILVTFCNEASEAAEVNDLTPKRFNDITAAHRADSELAERIQAAIREL